MKKIFLFALMAICLASCDDVNKCPSSPYKTHEWSMDTYSEGHYIQRCNYCNRHRRIWYNSDVYDYENMKTGDLNIKVSRNKVDK